MKVLLVSAVDVEGKHKFFEEASEGLAIPYIAAYIQKHLGSADITFVDRRFEQELDRVKPDIVGISFVTINYHIARRYADAAHARGIRVVGGGHHISAAPMTLPPGMDVGVIGEGEETLLDLLKSYAATGWCRDEYLRKIPGIVYRSTDGSLVVTEQRPVIKDIDSLPFPNRDMLSHRARGVVTSRGCPYKCSFCFRAHLDRKVRYHSGKRVVEEIVDVIERYRVKHLLIYDDMFAFPRSRFDYIVDALVATGIPDRVSFGGNVRPSQVDEHFARQLNRMNVTSVFMGLESGCQRVLSFLKPQDATVEQNERAIDILDRHGIMTSAGIILGSPDETIEEILQTLKWINSTPLDNFEPMLLTPLPGTPIWEDALARNLVSYDMDWGRLDIRADELSDREPVIVSKVLTREELLGLYDLFIKERDRHRLASRKTDLRKQIRNTIRNPRRLANKILDPESYRNLVALIRNSLDK
ncbi:MAG: radical SAM protein [bacterium]|nr:radical SAM protein [bacterium]